MIASVRSLPLLLLLSGWHSAAAETRSIPREPMDIGTTPQFLIDDYVVDNRWALNFEEGSKEMVERVFHAPRKHPRNPLFVPPRIDPPTAPQPGPSWLSVVRDPETGIFRMWYQYNLAKPGVEPGAKGVSVYDGYVCYAQSGDGLTWELPKLGLIDCQGSKDNNIVWGGPLPQRRGNQQQIVTNVPEGARHGYRYLMLFSASGINLIGSQDGIRWDESSRRRVSALPSDFPNNVLYDPGRGEFVAYVRAKHAYQLGRGDRIDTGDSRRVARMANKELWTEWNDPPQVVMAPDEIDAAHGCFEIQSMMVQLHAGIYWGSAHFLKDNTEIHPELTFSRDGLRFDRLPNRPVLIPVGPEGNWDSGLVVTAYEWVEVGDEWWLYYNAWNGPYHPNANIKAGKWRTAGTGVATVRKEGFVSMRGPEHGGVLCTRQVTWPGGELSINADATGGEIKVRVSDARRKVLPGFDYTDNLPRVGNAVAQEVKWKSASMALLTGKVVRLEFFLKSADLYTFRAAGSAPPPPNNVPKQL